MKKIKDWMEWRGITPKDLIMAVSTLGFLIFITGIVTYGFIVSLIN
jgi:hypothetical protein